MKEKEISLLEVFFEVLLHWRGVVASMLIGAVLLGGFSFAQSYYTWKTQQDRVEKAKEQLELMMQNVTEEQTDVQVQNEQNEQLIEMTLEWLEKRVTYEQRSNVNYAMLYDRMYLDKKEYIDESILMQMNPNSVQKSEITFLVTSDEMENSYSIEKVYEDIVCSGELYEAISSEMNMETSILGEIISLEKESTDMHVGTNILRLEIVHYERESCQKISQLVIDYLMKKSEMLEFELGKHDLSVLTRSLVSVADTNIMTYQSECLTDLWVIEERMNGTKAAFSDVEWQYYDFLVNGELTDLSMSRGETDTSTEMSLDEIISNGVTVYPSISVKYVVLGAILFAFIYAIVIFVLYVINARVRITDKLQELYSIPQLGTIAKNEKSTKFLGFIDDGIIYLRDYNKRKFTKEEAQNLAEVAVKIAAEKGSLNTVYLIGCDLKEQTIVVCEQIKTYLNEDNIHVEILNNVLYNVQAMSILQAAQGVVLVERAGSTLYAEIAQELELLKRLDIKVLGGIIVE